MINSISPLANWFVGDWQIERQIFLLPKFEDVFGNISVEFAQDDRSTSELAEHTQQSLDEYGFGRLQTLKKSRLLDIEPLLLRGNASFVESTHALQDNLAILESHVLSSKQLPISKKNVEISQSTSTSSFESTLHYRETLKYANNPSIKATQDYIYLFSQNPRTAVACEKQNLTICFAPDSWLNADSVNPLLSLKPFCSFDFSRILEGKQTYATPHLCGEDHYFVTLKIATQPKVCNQRLIPSLNSHSKRFNLEAYVFGPKKHYVAVSQFSCNV